MKGTSATPTRPTPATPRPTAPPRATTEITTRGAGAPGPAVGLVEQVRGDADGEEKGEQRGQQPAAVDPRRQRRPDHHVGEVPGGVGRVEQRPPLPESAAPRRVERRPPVLVSQPTASPTSPGRLPGSWCGSRRPRS